LKETESSLQWARNRKATVQSEIDTEDHWWKFWNWGLWNAKVKNLKAERDRLSNDITAYKNLQSQQETEIGRLETALASKGDAAAAAKVFEELAANLQDQLSQKRKALEDVNEAHKADIAAAEQEGDDKVKIFAKMIAKLRESVVQAQHQLGRINDNTHDLHTKLADAKSGLQAVIKEHGSILKNISASIALNEHETNEAKETKERDMKFFDATLAALASNKDTMMTSKSAAEATKKDAEKVRDSAVAGKEAEIKKLKTDLAALISAFNAEIAKQETAKVNQMNENAEVVKARKMKHTAATEKLLADIKRLAGQQASATQALGKLKEAEGLA